MLIFDVTIDTPILTNSNFCIDFNDLIYYSFIRKAFSLRFFYIIRIATYQSEYVRNSFIISQTALNQLKNVVAVYLPLATRKRLISIGMVYN